MYTNNFISNSILIIILVLTSLLFPSLLSMSKMSGLNQQYDFLEEIDDCYLGVVEQSYVNYSVQDVDINNYNYGYNNTSNSYHNNQYPTGCQPSAADFSHNLQATSTGALFSADLPSSAVSFNFDTSSNAPSLGVIHQSEVSSAAFTFSSNAAPDASLLYSDVPLQGTSVNSSSSLVVNLPVKQLLNGKIKEKMRAEGRQDASFVSSPSLQSDELTPEEKRKKLDKQNRNREAAQRSRQRKKESEQQLIRRHRILTERYEELVKDVSLLKLHIDKYEEYFTNHSCCITPQQDTGDAVSVETGSTVATEKKVIECALQLCDTYNTPIQNHQGSRAQQIYAIMSELKNAQQSEIVTSGAVYAENTIPSSGYNIGIQEHALPYSLYDGDRQEKFKPGLSNRQAIKSSSTTVVAMAGNSLPMFSEIGSSQDDPTYNTGSSRANNKNDDSFMSMIGNPPLALTNKLGNGQQRSNIYPWAIDQESDSEVNEALKIVQDILPPPEKKLRRE